MQRAAQPATSDLVADFRRAMRQAAASVHVITASDGETRAGMTATAVCSLSLEPPSMLVCVNRSASLFPVLLGASRFGINLLKRGQEMIAAQFGNTRDAASRFTIGTWYDLDGVAALADAQASIACRKLDVLDLGTHAIVTGEVSAVWTSSQIEPLVYLDGRFTSIAGAMA